MGIFESIGGAIDDATGAVAGYFDHLVHPVHFTGSYAPEPAQPITAMHRVSLPEHPQPITAMHRVEPVEQPQPVTAMHRVELPEHPQPITAMHRVNLPEPDPAPDPEPDQAETDDHADGGLEDFAAGMHHGPNLDMAFGTGSTAVHVRLPDTALQSEADSALHSFRSNLHPTGHNIGHDWTAGHTFDQKEPADHVGVGVPNGAMTHGTDLSGHQQGIVAQHPGHEIAGLIT